MGSCPVRHDPQRHVGLSDHRSRAVRLLPCLGNGRDAMDRPQPEALTGAAGARVRRVPVHHRDHGDRAVHPRVVARDDPVARRRRRRRRIARPDPRQRHARARGSRSGDPPGRAQPPRSRRSWRSSRVAATSFGSRSARRPARSCSRATVSPGPRRRRPTSNGPFRRVDREHRAERPIQAVGTSHVLTESLPITTGGIVRAVLTVTRDAEPVLARIEAARQEIVVLTLAAAWSSRSSCT